jgi:hypothetical protein
MRKLLIAAIATAALVATATPAAAGEITGNRRDLPVNGRSICAFSGQNDTPEGGGRDPGGRVQNYGQLVGIFGLIDPSTIDPRYVPAIPGFSCNPNRGEDLHAPLDF